MYRETLSSFVCQCGLDVPECVVSLDGESERSALTVSLELTVGGVGQNEQVRSIIEDGLRCKIPDLLQVPVGYN